MTPGMASTTGTTTSSTPSYEALMKCARRRIDEEWALTGRERAILLLVARLSFGCQQKWACVPKQEVLGRAVRLHKSDASKLIRGLIARRALQVLRSGGEVLYQVCLHDMQVPRREDDAEAQAALEELLRIQERRHNGRADADGQGRLPGLTAPVNEDVGLEADALRALLEEDLGLPSGVRNVTRGLELQTSEPGVSDLLARSEALMHLVPGKDEDSAELTEVDMEAVEAIRRDMEPARRHGADVLDHFKQGLSGELAYLWDCLVTEFDRVPGGRASLRRYAGQWRNRLLQNPDAVREAIGDHKLRKGGPADAPGAWMYQRFCAAGRAASHAGK